MAFDEKQGPICEGCKMPIDPTICQCGETIGRGIVHDNHYPVPMGCACHLKRDDVFDDGHSGIG